MNVYLGELYKEVEYIQSSGTQYIDTGYLITPTTEVSIDYQYTNANNQDFAFGVGSDSNISSGMTFCVYIGTSGGVAYFKAGLSDGTGSSTFTNNGPGPDTNRHKFVLNNGHFLTYNSSGTLQKDVTTSATFTRTATHSFGLFCWWRTDTSAWSNKTSAKLYGCKVTDNGVLQRDFIPCYRVSDNVIGLFDKVNNKFYTNAGTGTFTKGNDVKVFQPELKNAYIGEYVAPYEGDALCFTADAANSKLHFSKIGNPTSVTIEMNINGLSREPYTFGTIITLPNVGDKIYFRNTSTTTTGFSTSYNDRYNIACFSGSISCSGDVTYLLNKNGTTTLSNYCFCYLFGDYANITSCPKLLATTIPAWAYAYMFKGCTGLTSLPKIQATTFGDYCCNAMFKGCTGIKLSSTQTGAYQTSYRIPYSGTGTVGNYSLINMFDSTGGTFTGAPSVNTTYYTSNTVV